MMVALLSVGSYADRGCEEEEEYESAVGDPGMKRDGLRVAIEACNQCNEEAEEGRNRGCQHNQWKGKHRCEQICSVEREVLRQ